MNVATTFFFENLLTKKAISSDSLFFLKKVDFELTYNYCLL